MVETGATLKLNLITTNSTVNLGRPAISFEDKFDYLKIY